MTVSSCSQPSSYRSPSISKMVAATGLPREPRMRNCVKSLSILARAIVESFFKGTLKSGPVETGPTVPAATALECLKRHHHYTQNANIDIEKQKKKTDNFSHAALPFT